MKILLLADEPDLRLWDHLDRKLLEGIELVISCGDLPGEYLSFLTCFTNAPILYVHGNHDTRYDKKPPEGCICIEDSIYNFNGLQIAGLGGSMRYKPGDHQYTEWEMRKRLVKLLPKVFFKRGFDIMVTHAPAKGLGDSKDRAHNGFETFLWLMKSYKPRYMLHGHVHKEYSHEFVRERSYENTKVINAWMSYIIEI